MGSIKGNNRNQGPNRRRGKDLRRGSDFLHLEALEQRTLLDAAASSTPPQWKPTTSNVSDIQNGPLANAGQELIGVYTTFQANHGSGAAVAAKYPDLQIQGNSVGISVKGYGDFNSFVSTLKTAGMTVVSTAPAQQVVYGNVPINNLLSIAQSPQTVGLMATHKPQVYYQGSANNEADATMNGPTGRTTYSVNGSGVTVGVLSDSVNQYNGGLSESVSTGNLPSNVNVVDDFDPTDPGYNNPTDEGRAMLENIYDIAPGANLAFATASVGGDAGFAANIVKLATTAGAKVITDDIGYSDEPFFQDGIISQAIQQVVNQNGVTYFSAAGNSSNLGYLSQFRGVNTTVGSIGSGRFMDFDPNSGVNTQLSITTGPDTTGGGIIMQFDQPWYTTNGVTSQVNIYLLDSTGAVVSSATTNNIASQTPYQFLDMSAAKPNTTYTIAIQVASGADPGHVQFIQWGDSTLSAVSQQYGSAGGTYYPTTYGHSATSGTIGVGAVPWWGTQSNLSPSAPPVLSEPFSSQGPALIEYDSLGNLLSSPQLRQAPLISAPDGGNTSFFSPGSIIDTSNPPFPGQPATTTNLSQALPSFFGTSSAAPNAAAVAALLLSKRPTLTTADITSALIASASPVNGGTAGTWSANGGYGLIDANKALAAIDTLNVVSTTPANGATVATPPNTIVVTFSKPVNFSTISAADLVFTNMPAGVTAKALGAPIALDNPNFPTQVAFPYTIDAGQSTSGNGSYSFRIQGAIVSQDGKSLESPYTTTFNLQDTTAPKIIDTTINGRVITVQFSEPVRESEINGINLVLFRAGGVNNNFGQPENVNLANQPGFKISYNAATNTATLDFSQVSQAQFPTDKYIINVLSANNGGPGTGPGVQDLAGNWLDGSYTGTFPTGNGGEDRFVQYLGVQTLKAPTVSSVQFQPSSDTGITGDDNTKTSNPVFVGQVSASFPGTLSGLTVLAEFSGLHGGNFDLAPGSGGRGFTGSYDAIATTDANGTFIINAPALPEGYQSVRIVVIGQADSPPLPGLSSSYEHAFRIDNTAPQIIAATLAPGGSALHPTATNLSSLTNISLDVVDRSVPTTGALSTPSQVLFPALINSTAINLSNYSLVNVSTGVDYSQYITGATYTPTAADFVSNPNRTSNADPYYGRIDLTFAAGLPAGTYTLVAKGATGSSAGLTDAAGNSLDNTSASGNKNFQISFNYQPGAVYITSMQALSSYNGNSSAVVGGPRSYYELPAIGSTARANAPPTAFAIDFSTPLDPNANYSGAVLLIGSSNSAGGTPDGDFGTLGQGGLGATGSGFSIVAGTTVTLADSSNGALLGQSGFKQGTRLVLQLPAGTTLPADNYRIYMPNSGSTAIHDIYGNQLDGEFLGNLTSAGSTSIGNSIVNLGTQSLSSAKSIDAYESLMPDGSYRQNDLSGDGTAGGAFMTAFNVVPNGNVVYVNPSYVENPLEASTTPDGSIQRPYNSLAPEANAATAPSNPTHDPNGGVNSTSNFFNFNSNYDRNGNGQFNRSALYAAEQLSYRGPVVVVALPGIPQRDPITGITTQQTFVLQAPSGPNSYNDGSASVPFDTSLVMAPGSSIKFSNASLFVQNQGSSLEVLGGNSASTAVNFTSYFDDSVGGDTNKDGSNTSPNPGDWGGIVLRNFNQAGDATHVRNQTFPVDGTLKGLNGGSAISGADDALSMINYANIRYAGGALAPSANVHYDAVTLNNSRPTISNTTITRTGPGAGSNNSSGAAISGDLDSFREDDTARGPLIRKVTISQNGLNGVWVRPDSSGVAQASDAMIYPDNPMSLGGSQNYAFTATLPYVLTSQLDIGTMLLVDSQAKQPTSTVNTNGSINNGVTPFGKPTVNPNAPVVSIPAGTRVPVTTRLYIAPGMIIKAQRGSGIEVINPGSSLVVGSRSYINGFDSLATADPLTGLPVSTYGPSTPGFTAETTADAPVIFTSIYDNAATTAYFNPTSQTSTTIVAANNVTNNTNPANVPAVGSWGSITYFSGAYGVMNNATIQYGGGNLNIQGGTVVRNALSFLGATGGGTGIVDNATGNIISRNTGASLQAGQSFVALPGFGTRVMVTNNTFQFNGQAPGSSLTDYSAPIGITPNGLLATDALHPLTSGNPFFRNNILQNNNANGLMVLTSSLNQEDEHNLDVSSVWSATDIPYLLLNTIVPANAPLVGNFPATGGTSSAQPRPYIVQTIQSALPGTVLADGSVIPNPGQSVVVKLKSSYAAPAGNGLSAGTGNVSDYLGGAGFLFGVDNGVDPTASNFVDPGYNSQLRILGIGGNQTNGQQRVPAIMTSIYDNTVPLNVRGVDMSKVTSSTTAATPGDGGVIFFGSNSLTTFNALDIREGNKIDNADIRYLTRIELQGQDIYFPSAAFPNFQSVNQELTISNSNLANFSQVGVFSHPGFNILTGGGPRGQTLGAAAFLFMYNNTISNMPVGVRVLGMTGDNSVSPTPMEFLGLNNTFYNNPLGVDVIAVNPSPTNFFSHVHLILMNNIFAKFTTAINTTGRVNGSLGEYNLFDTATGALVSINNDQAFANYQPIYGDPLFVDPSVGNFQLSAGSPAIDAGRSEMSLNPTSEGAISTTLVSLVNQVLNAGGGTLNGNSRDPDAGNFTGTDILALPGNNQRGYVDQWVPALSTSSGYVGGPTYGSSLTAGVWGYAAAPPGVLDQLGSLRQKDPNSSNVGFGSNPFYDIGAYEYRTYNPPKVTGVTATIKNSSGGTTSTNIYKVGGVSGTNQTPQTIQFQLNHNIDPNTLTNKTVLLEASGGDGIFGNGNSSADKFIDLSGKLSFNSSTNILTVNLGAAGLTLSTDEYRIILEGSGSDVLRDPQGNALDGENTDGGNPNNPQKALPSGDGYPGGNFYLTFTINTNTSSVVPGSLLITSGSDTNRRDYITYNNLPSFNGQISVTTPAIDPLGGQTVLLQVSPNGDGNYYNAGSAFTNADGTFTVTVGIDAASTGLITNTGALPNSPYNVGPGGLLNSPANSSLAGGTITGNFNLSQARVVIINTAGNSSSTTDPNANTGFIVDNKGPVVTNFTPAAGTTLAPDSSGRVNFSFTTNKNLDPSSLNSGSLQVIYAGADGILGTADDTPVQVIPGSIAINVLKNGSQGPETITFAISASGLGNGVYGVTLKGTGGNTIYDIAGNPLNGTSGAAGSDYSTSYVVYSPSSAHIIYVGQASDQTNASADEGSRTNPYTTITDALAVAGAGDTVAVLPGVYTESIYLKSLVKLVSADPTSTATSVVPGNAQKTVIRAPSTSTSVQNTTVTAFNLFSVNGLFTEISGFTIASPLIGDAANGPIDSTSVGLRIHSSNILADKNYFVDSGYGVVVETNGLSQTPRLEDDGFIGNITGLLINDIGNSSFAPNAFIDVTNNTFAYNTFGIVAKVQANSPIMALVENNIFWENHDLTTSRNGAGINATVSNKLIARSNMFSGNGVSETNPATNAYNVGNGFNAAALTTTPDALGNFIGNPAFVTPRDPRPGGDGPAVFFNDGNFDLTADSAAIDAALNSVAPTTDFLSRGRVDIPGKGFPGTGPADIGAFEFQGTGGIAAGGNFRVVTTSIAPGGNVHAAGITEPAPNKIIVNFSGHIDRSTVTPTDLVISGSGINGSDPARATSLSWIDDHTVAFNLSGKFNSTGTVSLSIAQGAVSNLTNNGNNGFADNFKIGTPAVQVPTPTPTPTPAPPPAPAPAPAPAPSPTPAPTGRLARLALLRALRQAARLGRR